MEENIPPIEQQCIIIRAEFANQLLNKNEKAFALSTEWFQRWKRASGFYTKEPPTYDCPQIDNSKLLLNNVFNESLTEGIDFIIIKSTTWDIFYSWYQGGPSIAFTVEYDPTSKQNVAITKKISVTITCQGQPFKITTSVYKLFSELKAPICKRCKLSLDDYSIYKYSNCKKGDVCDDSKALVEMNIANNQEFVLSRSPPNINSANSNSMINRPMLPKSALLLSHSVPFNIMGEKSSIPGTCGLQNFGNTCFFNSSVQCLIHTPQLVKYIQDDAYLNEISRSNPLGTKGMLVGAFATVVKEIWSGTSTVVAPRTFLGILQKHAPYFSGYQQQDAHELLLYLLDLIHEDLNRVDDKPNIESTEGDGTNDSEMAEIAWKKHKMRNDSIIVDLFHGMLRSHINCPFCKTTRAVFDPFLSLSLHLPNQAAYLPFVFVPFDMMKPKLFLRLPITFPIDISHFKILLFSEIKYECEIAFAVKNTNFEYSFFLSPPLLSRGSTLVVFEIPSTDKTYSLARLNFKVKGLFKVREKYLEASLLEIPSENTTSWQKMQFAVDERFAYLWEGKCTETDINNNELYKTRKTFQKLGFNTKLVIPETDYVLNRNNKLPFLSAKVLDVSINSAFIKETYHFNWNRIERETVENPSNFKIEEPSLENNLQMFSKSSTLDEDNMWYCPNCKKHVGAEKKMDIWSLPKCLVINFKRFSVSEKSSRKIETNVNYPKEIDFAPFIVGPQRNTKQVYRLYAVIHHFGQLNGGHYTASAKVESIDKWYYFNDAHTKETTAHTSHAQSAYVLFYRKVE